MMDERTSLEGSVVSDAATTITFDETMGSDGEGSVVVIGDEAILLGKCVGHDTKRVRIPWAERLFSRPWKPWRKYREYALPIYECTRGVNATCARAHFVDAAILFPSLRAKLRDWWKRGWWKK